MFLPQKLSDPLLCNSIQDSNPRITHPLSISKKVKHTQPVT